MCTAKLDTRYHYLFTLAKSDMISHMICAVFTLPWWQISAPLHHILLEFSARPKQPPHNGQKELSLELLPEARNTLGIVKTCSSSYSKYYTILYVRDHRKKKNSLKIQWIFESKDQGLWQQGFNNASVRQYWIKVGLQKCQVTVCLPKANRQCVNCDSKSSILHYRAATKARTA